MKKTMEENYEGFLRKVRQSRRKRTVYSLVVLVFLFSGMLLLGSFEKSIIFENEDSVFWNVFSSSMARMEDIATSIVDGDISSDYDWFSKLFSSSDYKRGYVGMYRDQVVWMFEPEVAVVYQDARMYLTISKEDVGFLGFSCFERPIVLEEKSSLVSNEEVWLYEGEMFFYFKVEFDDAFVHGQVAKDVMTKDEVITLVKKIIEGKNE